MEQELFGRRAKLDWLTGGAEAGSLPDAMEVDRGLLDDLRPKPFQNGEWLSIHEAFLFATSGMQTKRDRFIYAFSHDAVLARLRAFASLDAGQAREMFHDSRDRKWTASQNALRNEDGGIAVDESLIADVAYRPFDRRKLFNSGLFGDFLRPALQAARGASNFGIYGLKSGTGAGPAVWSHALLPDYHSIKGSNGGYAFPLYDRRAGPEAANLNPALIAGLSAAYGAPVTPEDAFDAILALLSATSYTRTFAEDLEDVFPHIPFPATRAVFDQAVTIGRDIRAVEGFARQAEARFRPLEFFRLRSDPTGLLAAGIEPRDGEIMLCADGSGRVSGVSEAVWSFAVSGYRVLPRWIEARAGLLAESLWPDLRDIASRIAELIHRFDEADLVLTATLADSLRREALGFPDADPEDLEDDD